MSRFLARPAFINRGMTHLIVRLVALAALGIQLAAVLSTAQPAGAVSPGPPHFESTWARVDRPVDELLVSRSWLWGPEANTGVLTEQYDDAPGEMREVQYFDKSRMEINNPASDPASPWFVTNGLLVVELMTGEMQVGDDSFVERTPAAINVAGDADDPDGPTYQTFAGLRDEQPLADGATISQRVDRDGNITDDPDLAAFGATAANHVQVPGIDHQVASPFWAFMNSSGLIYDEADGFIQGDLFLSPFYATGYPLTEAYWATVEVAGTPKDVLSQCFERRCLTYTPDNEPGWQVEAGNVGLHYHAWRYSDDGGDNHPSPPADGLPLINEIKFWPVDGDLQWIELLNPSDEPADLNGMRLTNSTLDHVSLLPDVELPVGAYLVVYFGEGENDLDFGDLRGVYYDADAPEEFFDPDHDEVGLYEPGQGVDSIIDFFYWTFGDPYQPQDAYDDAVGAGIWTADDYFDASRTHDLDFVHPVSEGETVGRDADSTDTDGSGDWAELGGEDALGETPTYRNFHQLVPSEGGEEPPPPPPANPKEWTVLAFGDGRSDQRTYRAVTHELNKMEAAGSDENINIVAQLAWASGASTSARRWYFNTDTDMSQLRSPGFALEVGETANPGDPRALADFISWAETNYPANKYAIVFIGHGQGWKGTMLAGEDSDFLKMSELETGLSALSQKFEVVEFESCMMGQVEVGYQIEPTANMMVASEEVIWGVLPWTAFLEELKANPGWSAGEYADRKAEMNADAHRAVRSASARSFFTLASVDLSGIVTTLAPAITTFATALIDDVDDVNQRDLVADNSQMTIKHAVLEQTEYFSDSNYKDLFHLADLASNQPLKAAAPANPVKVALTEGGPVIRWEDHGPGNPNAHGLSTYFPHDLLLPDGRVETEDGESATGHYAVDSFDDPKYDPEINPDTHLYKLDAAILLPRLAGEPHAMADDPDFDFPSNTTWDEFLHRYYKPVADACILTAADCVKEITVKIGTDVPLSGRGSSDSDGPEDAATGDWLDGAAGGNDVPAHTTTAVEHYYWDYNAEVDNPAPKPNYSEGQLYAECDIEDCDRDDVDDPDDDRDAVGKTPIFPCAEAGTFVVRLMVWDEHHDHERERNENRDHNEGRHWLHFNVHSDTVTIHCTGDDTPRQPRKAANKDEVGPAGDLEYTIEVPANPELTAVSDAVITDSLPALVQYGEILQCSAGECGYDAELNVVYMQGATISPGGTLTLRFSVTVAETIPPSEGNQPPEILNCATVYDGLMQHEVCDSTTIVIETAPPSTGTGETARSDYR